MIQVRPQPARLGAVQGLALIALAGLPTMAIVSLVPNLPQLFRQFGGLPQAALWVPMVLTLPSLCIALLSPVAGWCADRWGRRPVLLVSLLLFTVVGVLPFWMAALPAVLLTRLAVGIAEAGILTCQNALLGDYFQGSDRQRWLGWQSILSPVLAASMVLAGGWLGSIGWQWPFLLYLLGAPVLLWAYWGLPEPKRTDRGAAPPTGSAAGARADAFPWRAGWPVMAVTVAASVLYFVQAVQLGRVFGEQGVGSPAEIGVYVTLASLGVMLGGWVFTRLPPMGLPRMLSLILLCYAVGWAGMGMARSPELVLVASWAAQFGNGLAIPALIGWSLSRFDLAQRGRGMGLWGSAFFAGTFLSPPLVALATDLAGGAFLKALVLLAGVCLVLAVPLALVRGGRPAGVADTPAVRA